SDAASHEAAILTRTIRQEPLVICECCGCHWRRADVGRDARHRLGRRTIPAPVDLSDQPPARRGARPASRYRGLSRRSAPPGGPYLSWFVDLASWRRLVLCEHRPDGKSPEKRAR